MCVWSLGFFQVLTPFWPLGLFSYLEIVLVLPLTCSFYSRGPQIWVAIVLGSVIMIHREFTKVLEFVPGMLGLWFLHLTLCSSSSSMFWEFISIGT